MKSLKVLSQLDILHGNLITSLTKKSNTVFLQQGSVDGACGPYCVFMALIILGIVSYDDATNLWRPKRSTRFGKMLAKMQEHDTLFQNGTHLHQLEELLQISFKNALQTEVSNSKGRELIKFVVEQLKQDRPVITGVLGKSMAHWLLAIGFEEDSEGNVSKILFLDPSSQGEASYFNAIIDVNQSYSGRYPYNWVSSTDALVSFEDGISIGQK